MSEKGISTGEIADVISEMIPRIHTMILDDYFSVMEVEHINYICAFIRNVENMLETLKIPVEVPAGYYSGKAAESEGIEWN